MKTYLKLALVIFWIFFIFAVIFLPISIGVGYVVKWILSELSFDTAILIGVLTTLSFVLIVLIFLLAPATFLPTSSMIDDIDDEEDEEDDEDIVFQELTDRALMSHRARPSRKRKRRR